MQYGTCYIEVYIILHGERQLKVMKMRHYVSLSLTLNADRNLVGQ